MKKLTREELFGGLAVIAALLGISLLLTSTGAKDMIADVSAEVLHSGYKDVVPNSFISGATLVDIRSSLRNEHHADTKSLIRQYKYLGLFISETATYITFSNSPVKQRVTNENCSHGSDISICAITGRSIKPPSQSLVFIRYNKIDQYTIVVYDGSQTIELRPIRYSGMYKNDDRFVAEVFSY